MTSVKARLNRSRVGKDGMYPLVIQLIRGREKREIYTSYRLLAEEFDCDCELALLTKRNRQRASLIAQVNLAIHQYREALTDLCGQLSAASADYTVHDVVDAYRHHDDLNRVEVYTSYIIEQLKSEGRNGTAANYRSSVSAFLQFINNPCYTFADLSRSDVERFVASRKEKGNSPNTIDCYLRQWNAICNKAADDGIIAAADNPFSKIKVKDVATQKRALTKEQLSDILKVDTTGRHAHLELAKDLFHFSLLTRGMSFVDMAGLREEDMQEDTFSYCRRKTGQRLTVHIEPSLRKLIDKYHCDDSPYLLPMLRPNDSYNGYRYIQRRLNKRIHEVGVLAGFSFDLTFYAARHSWATFARDAGVPLSLISQCMGHTKESTTQIYLQQIDHRELDSANRKVIRFWS